MGGVTQGSADSNRFVPGRVWVVSLGRERIFSKTLTARRKRQALTLTR
jgi:hypothetical protein